MRCFCVWLFWLFSRSLLFSHSEHSTQQQQQRQKVLFLLFICFFLSLFRRTPSGRALCKIFNPIFPTIWIYARWANKQKSARNAKPRTRRKVLNWISLSLARADWNKNCIRNSNRCFRFPVGGFSCLLPLIFNQQNFIPSWTPKLG